MMPTGAEVNTVVKQECLWIVLSRSLHPSLTFISKSKKKKKKKQTTKAKLYVVASMRSMRNESRRESREKPKRSLNRLMFLRSVWTMDSIHCQASQAIVNMVCNLTNWTDKDGKVHIRKRWVSHWN